MSLYVQLALSLCIVRFNCSCGLYCFIHFNLERVLNSFLCFEPM
jgi:hypothetical protein